MQPGTETAARPEGVDLPVGDQEGLLREVVRRAPVAGQQAPEEAANRGLVPDDQLLEGGLVIGAGDARRQLQVGNNALGP